MNNISYYIDTILIVTYNGFAKIEVLMNCYLNETTMLDFSSPNIKLLIKERGWNHLDEKDKVAEIYNFVKDEILFGYNVGDHVAASEVLKDGYGQCNTKGTLLMALYRACGVQCRIHCFYIDKILQKGAMTGFVYKKAPRDILHSWVEVNCCGKWYNLEGFILDKEYLDGLRKTVKANEDGSFIGYGVAVKDFENPVLYFDDCDTYVQSEGITKDFGVYSDPDSMLKEHSQKIRGLKKLAFETIGRRSMNRNVAKIRAKAKQSRH